jgi:hypothetical protein
MTQGGYGTSDESWVRTKDSATIETSAAEKDMAIVKLPAGALNVKGATLRVRGAGTAANVAPGNLEFILYVNGVLLSDLVIAQVTGDFSFETECLVRTAQASDAADAIVQPGYGIIVLGGAAASNVLHGETPIQLLGSVDVKLTGQMSVSDAGNTFKLSSFSAEIVYPNNTF